MRVPAAGELREKINIVNVSAPYDALGRGTVISTAASDLAAKIEPLAGGITDLSQNEQVSSQPYYVWLRYRRGVTAFQQFVWGSRRLIQTGPPEEIIARRWLLCHAVEKSVRTI